MTQLETPSTEHSTPTRAKHPSLAYGIMLYVLAALALFLVRAWNIGNIGSGVLGIGIALVLLLAGTVLLVYRRRGWR